MKHYPLLDKGVNISVLEPFDFVVMVGVSFIVALIAFIFIHMYAVFVLVAALIVSFVVMRKVKSNKNNGYIARKVMFKLLRRNHKIY